MLENCNETMNEFATIVSKANNKGEVMVLMDSNDLKKKKDYAVSEYMTMIQTEFFMFMM